MTSSKQLLVTPAQLTARAFKRLLLSLTLLSVMSTHLQAEILNIAATESFEPYIIHDRKGWRGVDIEINRALMKRLGFEPEYQGVPWTRQLAYVEKGISGALLTVYCDDKRAFIEIVEEPFYEVRISLFARKDASLNISSLQELPTHARVGVVRENFFGKHLEAIAHIETAYTHDTPNLAAQLFHARIDFAYEEFIPFTYYAKKHGYAQQFKELLPVQRYQVCTAYSRTYFGERTAKLAQRTKTVIQQMKKEGVITRILDQYAPGK